MERTRHIWVHNAWPKFVDIGWGHWIWYTPLLSAPPLSHSLWRLSDNVILFLQTVLFWWKALHSHGLKQCLRKTKCISYYEPQSFKTEIWFLQFIKDRFGNGHVGWFFDDYEKMHQPASARNLKGYSHAWPLWFITNSFHIHRKLHEKGKFTIVNKLLQNNCYKTWNRKYLALVAQMNLAWIRRLGVQVTPWVLPPKHPFMLVENTNG